MITKIVHEERNGENGSCLVTTIVKDGENESTELVLGEYFP